MRRLILVERVAGPALGLALAVAALPAAASAQAFGLVGKITKVSATSLQIRTSGGLVTEKLTSSTVIRKVTRGSLRDVTKGTFVVVTLSSTGKTVVGINIGSRFGGPGRRPGTGGRTGRPRGAFPGGQVVSVGNGRITLRTVQGTTASYALSKNVTVTRTVADTRGDLRVGETVRIGARPGSTTAFSVTIESG